MQLLKRIKRACKIIFVLFTFAFLGACTTHTVYVPQQPPQVKVEVKPARLYPRVVWIQGHWKWRRRHHRYVWVPGHWKKAPTGRVWVAGNWKKTHHGWIWIKGYWK